MQRTFHGGVLRSISSCLINKTRSLFGRPKLNRHARRRYQKLHGQHQVQALEPRVLLSATISGSAWYDDVYNNLQGVGDSQASAIVVNLLDSAGTQLDTTATVNGDYSFTALADGDYIIEFELPANYSFVLQGVGVDESVDSDVDVLTGRSQIITLSDTDVVDIDAGFVLTSELPETYSGTLELSSIAAGGLDGVIFNGIDGGDYAGAAISSAGDVNGDGYDDLLIGAYGAQPNGSYSGETYLVYGDASGWTTTIELSDVGSSVAGAVFNGVDNNDGAGVSVSSAGDMNGDGYDDLFIGAGGAANGGRSYLVYGSASGLTGTIELADVGSSVDGAVFIGTSSSGNAGSSVSNAGDVNGDGYLDLLIGANFASPNGSQSGQTFLVYGTSSGFSGNVALADVGSTVAGAVFNGIAGSDNAGWDISAAGDVNGDGYDDLLIGSRYATGNADDSGQAYLVYGSASDLTGTLELSDLGSSIAGAIFNGAQEDDRVGWDISGAGDVNGDGYDDLLISGFFVDSNGQNNAGSAYLIYGQASGLTGTIDLSDVGGSVAGVTFNGIDEDDFAGRSVSSAGDVNGDGYDDVIIGAPYANPNGGRSGETYLVYGQSSGLTGTIELSEIGSTVAGVVFNGIAGGDYSGIKSASAGDVNGDGYDDLLIGAQNAKPNGNNSGQSYLVYGGLFKPTDVYVDDDWASVSAGVDPDGSGAATNFGYDAFATIQDAIDAVADGGTVHVLAGNYDEYLTINRSMTVTGESGDAADVVIAPTFHNSTMTAITVSSTTGQVALQNMSINTSLAYILVGIVASGTGGTGNDLTFTNVDISNATGSGILGINVYNYDGLVTIDSSTIDGFDSNSIEIIGSDVILSGNTMTGSEDYGVHAINANLSILNNQIICVDTSFHDAYSIYLDGGTALIQGNDLRFSNNGIYITNGALVDAGDYNDTNITGLGTGSMTNGSSNGHNLLSNTNTAINNENLDSSSAPDVLAQMNFFGMYTSSEIEDVVHHDTDDAALTVVDYGNFLTQPTDVYVDDDWSSLSTGVDPDGTDPAISFGYDAFATIEEALAAVTSGGTIHILAGTYEGDLIINNSVTLQGETGDAADVVIDQSTSNGKAISVLTSSVDTIIKNLTIQVTAIANGINGDGSVGNSLTLDNVTVTGADVYGMYARNYGGLVSLNNVTFDDNSRGVIIFDSSNIRITNSTIINNGALGIDIYDSNATYINNTITDNYIGMAFSGSTAIVEGNDLTGNTVYGILLLSNSLLDAGDSSDTNVTGLGTGSQTNGSSAGGNILSGYSSTVHAIHISNTLSLYDAWAQMNYFGFNTLAEIEDVVYHKPDNASLSTVHYDNFLAIPTDVYVDDDWAGYSPGIDPDGSGNATHFGYDAFASIQDAIDAVGDGGIVHILAGTYDEALTIDQSVTLTGDSGIASDVIIEPTSSTASVIDVLDTSLQTYIYNLTIQGSNYTNGITVAGNAGNSATNLNVANVVINGAGNGNGIDVDSFGGYVNFDNVTTDGHQIGMKFNNAFYVQVRNSAATNNTSSDGAVSVTGSQFVAQNNTWTNNVVGLLVDDSTAMIEDNVITSNSYAGIIVQNGSILDAGDFDDNSSSPITAGSMTTGKSAGNNILTGYSSSNYAIINLNQDSNGDPDVYAQMNDFGFDTAAQIAQVIYDDADDNTNTVVHYDYFQTSLTDVYVDDDWASLSNGDDPDGSGPLTAIGFDAFATIQEALTAVTTGGTVHVLAGQYDSALSLTRSVNLVGESGDAADVEISASSISYYFSTINVGTTTGPVSLQNLTVTTGPAFSQSGISTAGKGAVDNDLTITNVDIVNTGYAIFGIYATNLDGHLTVESSTIGGFTYGMEIINSDATLTGNAMTYSTAFAILSINANLSVLNNQINDNNTGMLLIGGSALIEGNDLRYNNTGIAIADGALVDAGDYNDTNVTGLGTGSMTNGSSNGHNLLSDTDTAIDNGNLDSSGDPDVMAQMNYFGLFTASEIEDVVYHDTDDSSLTVVDYGNFLTMPTLVYVDDDWASLSTGVDPDGSDPAISFGYDAFATIEEALAAVAEGGTIYVAAGDYDESTLAIDKAISIIGEDDQLVNIDFLNDGTGFAISVGDVSLSGLTISDATLGISINASNATVANFVFDELTIDSENAGTTDTIGLKIVNADVENLNLINSTISHFETGIQLGVVTTFSGLLIDNNTFSNLDDGLLDVATLISDADITNNTFTNISGTSLYFLVINDTDILGNEFNGGNNGIVIFNTSVNQGGYTIADNTFSNHKNAILNYDTAYTTQIVEIYDNTITIDVALIESTGAGISYANYNAQRSEFKIYDNQITITGTPGDDIIVSGISIIGVPSDVLIARNTIDGGDVGLNDADVQAYGVYYRVSSVFGLMDANDQLVINHNAINHFDAAFAIHDDINDVFGGFGTQGKIRLYDNDLSGNAATLIGDDNDARIRASQNWWGTDDPVAIATTITGNIDFSGILVSGTDTDLASEGFQGDFSALLIHKLGGQQNNLFMEAIDAVDAGGTIYVYDGTYTEDVTVDNGITIKGTFDLNGTLTLTDDASLAPGNSPGIMNTGSVSMGSGTSLDIEIDGTTVGTEHDQLNVTGTVDITDSTLNIILGYTPTDGDSYIIINNDGIDATSGTFDGLAEGDQIVASGMVFTISYVGGDGNDVELTYVHVNLDDVYVDDDWAGLSLGVDPDGAGPATAIGVDAFAVIQDGVDAVADGGTVHVYDGTYYESVYIWNKDLTVTGVSQDATQVIVNSQFNDEVFDVYGVDAVTIEYLTAINGSDDLIDIENSGVITLDHLILNYADDDGIDAEHVNELYVSNTTIQYLSEDGLSLYDIGQVVLTNVNIYDGLDGSGVYFEYGGLLDINGLNIASFEYYGIATAGVDEVDIFDATIHDTGASGMEIYYGDTVYLEQVEVYDAQDYGLDIYDQLLVELVDVTVHDVASDGMWLDYIDEVYLTRVTSQYNAWDGIYITGVGSIELLDVNSSYNEYAGLHVEVAETLSDTNGIYTENEDSGILVIYVTGESTFTRTTATNNNADGGDYGVGLEIYGFPFDDIIDDFEDFYGGFEDFLFGLPGDFFDLLPDDFLNFDFANLPFPAGGSVTIEGGNFSDTDSTPYLGNVYNQTAGIVIEGIQGDVNIIAHDDGNDIQTTSVTGNDEIGVVLYNIAGNINIEDADISDNYGQGLDVDNAYDVTIANTTFNANNGYGVWITEAGNVSFTDIVAQFNHMGLLLGAVDSFSDTDGLYADNSESGMQLSNIANTLVMTGSIVRDNGTKGIWFSDQHSVDFSQLTVTGNDVGIFMEDFVLAFELTNSFVTGNRVGVQIGELYTNFGYTLFDNDLSGNTEFAIVNNDTSAYGATAPIDAAGNWFGSADPIALLVEIDGLVDYSYFLTSGSDTSVASGFQGDFTTLYATYLGSQIQSISRIQEAIDNVDSDGMVFVQSGPYDGDVTVDANKTLQGAISFNGTLNLTDNATFVPGNSPGVISIADDFVGQTGTTLVVEINGDTIYTDYDILFVEGNVTLDGMSLDVTLGYVPDSGDTITLIDNVGSNAVNSSFEGLPEGTTITINGYDATITYVGGDGNDVQLVFQESNVAPTADVVNDVAVEDGGPVVIAYNADDANADDDASTLTYNFITTPSEGSVTDNGDGTFTFDPGSDFQDLGVGQTRVVSFTYQATDSHGLNSSVATINITVSGTNDGVNAAPNLASTEYDTPIDIDVLANDVDIDGDVLHVLGFGKKSWDTTVVGITELGATVTINPDGSVHYDPTGAFDSLTPGQTVRDSILYFAQDPYGLSDRHTLFIDVTRPVITVSTASLNLSTLQNTLPTNLNYMFGNAVQSPGVTSNISLAALAFASQQAQLHVAPTTMSGSHWLNNLLGDDEQANGVNLVAVESD